MENYGTKVDHAVAARLKALRTEGGLTLDQLAEASGVSRAMISRIERGEASPTAVLLARLCSALGESLSSFFAAPESGAPLMRAADQPQWTDPASGYVRRAVSPPRTGSPVDLVDVTMPPGQSVSFPPQASSEGVMQHVWVLSGQLVLTVADVIHEMSAGDCLYHDIGRGHSFANKGTEPVRYAVVLEHKRVR